MRITEVSLKNIKSYEDATVQVSLGHYCHFRP